MARWRTGHHAAAPRLTAPGSGVNLAPRRTPARLPLPAAAATIKTFPDGADQYRPMAADPLTVCLSMVLSSFPVAAEYSRNASSAVIFTE